MIVGLQVSRYVTVAILLLTFSLFGAWKQSILVTQNQKYGEWRCLGMTIELYPLP